MGGRKGDHLLKGLEDQIALGEIEDKGLDHLQHITWLQFEPGETIRQRVISKDGP